MSTPVVNDTFPNPTNNSKTNSARQVLFLLMISGGALFVIFFVIGILHPSYQAVIPAGISLVLVLVCLSIHTRLLPVNDSLYILVPFTFVVVLFLALSLFITNAGLISATILIIFGVLTAGTFFPGRRLDLGIILSVAASAVISAVNSISPFPQLSLDILPSVLTYLLFIIEVGFVLTFLLLLLPSLINTISIKLITASLTITLVPLFILSSIQFQFLQEVLENQTNQTLRMAAKQSALRLDDFISTNIANVESDSKLNPFLAYLLVDPNKRKGSPEEKELSFLVESLKSKGGIFLSSIGILDLKGKDIFDSNLHEIGNIEFDQLYYREPLLTGQTYSSPVLFSQSGNPYLYFSSPIRNENQQILGVLRVRYDAYVLQELLADARDQLGSRSYAILVDEHSIRLADTITPSNIYKSLSWLSSEEQGNLISSYRLPIRTNSLYSTDLTELSAKLDKQLETPFFTADVIPGSKEHTMSVATARLSSQTWQVIFMREHIFVTRLLQNQSKTNTLMVSLLAGLIGIIATLLARVLSNPIVRLQVTAEEISSGNLEVTVPIQSSDEIGSLGQAFNKMTQQLKGFIAELEDRVQSRTEELAKQNEELIFRSQQLETVAEVARQIVSAQELEELLSQITRLVSERFGFYHVGIFLLDQNREYAILRAANSEGGQRMLANQHKLKVGALGIVGYVTGYAQPRIATDVGDDAIYFSNPDLPETRSEMALPLKIGDKVIGALDVQSTISNAFSPDDVSLFSTLADQIAIAIRNNELYIQTVKALREAQRIHQRYLHQEWQREITDHQYRTYIYTPDGLVIKDPMDPSEGDPHLQTEESLIQSIPDGDPARAPYMLIPITLRGENIGVIQIQEKPGTSREWTDDEISIVNSISNQVAQAVENARLFDQTTRRANRERKVLEITSRIRSTNDPQAMLKITLEELRQALNTTRAQILIQVPPEPDTGSIPDHDSNVDSTKR